MDENPTETPSSSRAAPETETPIDPNRNRKPYSGELLDDKEFKFDERVIEGLKYIENNDNYLESTIERTLDQGYKTLEKWKNAVREEDWSDAESYGRRLADIYEQIDLLKGFMRDRYGLSLAPASFNTLAEKEDSERDLQRMEEKIWSNDFVLEEHQEKVTRSAIINYGMLRDMFREIGGSGMFKPRSHQEHEEEDPEDHTGDFRLIMGGPAEVRNQYRDTEISDTLPPATYSSEEKFLEMEQENLEEDRGWRKRMEDILEQNNPN